MSRDDAIGYFYRAAKKAEQELAARRAREKFEAEEIDLRNARIDAHKAFLAVLKESMTWYELFIDSLEKYDGDENFNFAKAMHSDGKYRYEFSKTQSQEKSSLKVFRRADESSSSGGENSPTWVRVRVQTSVSIVAAGIFHEQFEEIARKCPNMQQATDSLFSRAWEGVAGAVPELRSGGEGREI